MQTQQQAYDLSRFAPVEPTQRLRVVENNDKQKIVKNKFFRNLKIVFLTSILLTLACFVLASQATITELSGEIADKQEMLTEEKATSDYLTYKLGGSVNLENVAKYAEQTLGLIKMDSTQIEYITLENENVIETNGETLASIFDGITTNLMSLMEYLAP